MQNKGIIEKQRIEARIEDRENNDNGVLVAQWKGGMFPVGRSSRSYFSTGEDRSRFETMIERLEDEHAVCSLGSAARQPSWLAGALGFTFDTSWRALRAAAFTHMLVPLDPPRATAPFAAGVSCGRWFYRSPGISTPSRRPR